MNDQRAADTLYLAARCIEGIASLHAAPDLYPEEVSLRLAQYAACARGEAVPEVAFDPVAITLCAVAATLAAHPEARAAWDAWVGAAAGDQPPNDVSRAA